MVIGVDVSRETWIELRPVLVTPWNGTGGQLRLRGYCAQAEAGCYLTVAG